ncbi:hypothetical protein HPG69_008737 [Diceros bicornis minor]|uniref:Androgen-dependent TFPI-regulating protein n=1 Tax=Diceros bicornis minor TaxID=77932 RepID=A0A7J7FAL9_DICBM|nr:hypothetical protein HPG69_008737 [Diceros bicornis minor]
MDARGCQELRKLGSRDGREMIAVNHTSILPFSLAEVILRPHYYLSKKKGLTVLAAASLAYVGRVLWIYSETGMWVYPVFAKLSSVGLAAFFSLSYILSAGIYLLGEKLNHWKWEGETSPKGKAVMLDAFVQKTQTGPTKVGKGKAWGKFALSRRAPSDYLSSFLKEHLI